MLSYSFAHESIYLHKHNGKRLSWRLNNEIRVQKINLNFIEKIVLFYYRTYDAMSGHA